MNKEQNDQHGNGELTPEQNYEQLIKKLYYSGFGESLNEKLQQAMMSGTSEFTLEHYASIGEDEMGYRLHFRRDEKTDRVYFNKYDSALLLDKDNPGEVKEHTFFAEKNITALEAYRMLKHGDLVAVNKDLYNKDGKAYNVWISIDTSGNKDEYNNYPVNTYHQNYYKKQAFNLKAILATLPVPVKELELPAHRDNVEKALRKATLVEVTMQVDGKEVKGYLSADPKIGTVHILDQDQVPLELTKGEAMQQKHQQQAEDVKKKSWGQKTGGMKQTGKGPRW